MASLDPNQYPTPTTTMLQLAPAGDERGDNYLDRETVVSFIQAATDGTFALNPDWMPQIAEADEAVLETRFLEWLRGSRLGPKSPVLHHRRLALFEAIRELGSPGTVPGFGLSVHNVTRSIGELETWLEGKRQELLQRQLSDDNIVRMLAVLPPSQLAPLLATSEANLSRWRQQNSGPRYAKTGQRSVVYPVVAVLEWLNDLVVT